VRRLSATALLLAACSAPRVEGSGARIYASDEFAERLCALVKMVEPPIIAMLGTRWTRAYDVEVDESLERYFATTTSWNRRVRIGRRALSPDEFDHAVAHELVHVHMRGQWLDMPAAVQEGVANFVGWCALGKKPVYRGPEPTPEELRRVLSISNREYLSLSQSETREIDRIGAWLASKMFPPEQLAHDCPTPVPLPERIQGRRDP
jgi:hypothetical protein